MILLMKRPLLLRISWLALAGFVTCLPALAQSTPAQTPPVIVGEKTFDTGAALRQETFEQVWRTINEKHFDPTFGGVNWAQVHERYAPQVAAAANAAAFYALLQQMIGELHQSHFAIVPPEAVVEDEVHQPATGELGVAVKLLGAEVVISQVKAGSVADRAGVRPGFNVQRINGVAVASLLEKMSKSPESASLKRLRLERQVLARLNGAAGQAVSLSYLDGHNQSHQVELVRDPIRGEFSPAFGNLPPQLLDFEAKRLPSGYGYIRFNIFVMPMMEKIRAALRELNDAPGLIFDLRGNPGGIGGMASGISGHLCKAPASLGKMQMRSGYTNFAIFPQALVYAGPVAIIVDNGSASTSEIFAGGLQELKRASVIGERTAGAALPSVIQKLPTGALFQYAIGDFKTPQGTLLEGRGVLPDVPVTLTRAALLAGRDLSLEAAIKMLQVSPQPGRKASKPAGRRP
jgi:carboxyl-terminal processing protease